ncbi:PEP-CTERM sorting domain-containing protein [Leptolyngbya sp. NIES-2104]|uniref:PEP-CTERM sorting domain-containing protein n=1 Tax=Leptolyngbya sp. NIES-2104 TaxID=1552121 RepID=UPI00178CAD56|nr:PEP-CTERM sorting domain-containing protein [Leptolyngbya sp. NIES-2104]
MRRQPQFRCAPVENLKESSRRHRGSTIALTLSLGWLTSSLALPVRAADLSIGNEGVRVNRDATLESEFVESHGAYQSTFGVINLTTKEKTPLLIETRPSDSPDTIFRPSTKIDDAGTQLDFPGTPGNAVPQTANRYTFRPNNDYVFYLESSFNGRPTGILYSTDRLNPNAEQHVRFTGNINALCQTGGMQIGWDDTGSRIVRNRPAQDRDFDDFTVRLRDTACPIGQGEPPPVVSPISPGTPIGQVPVAPIAGGTTGGGFLLPLVAVAGLTGLGFAIAGGDDGGGGSGGGGGGGTPPEVIPEPMTILGSSAAVGFATLMQRRRAKKKKKKD